MDCTTSIVHFLIAHLSRAAFLYHLLCKVCFLGKPAGCDLPGQGLTPLTRIKKSELCLQVVPNVDPSSSLLPALPSSCPVFFPPSSSFPSFIKKCMGFLKQSMFCPQYKMHLSLPITSPSQRHSQKSWGNIQGSVRL